ncbi:T9SS type A sorting domain-containing protein [Lentimicrobium sp.]|uniref:T9SS type A sorting domain-containing protein n=1 Tax=Lentimicrobium sp. TaxID=2034841 RepID=UPI002D0C3C38|nr:T9SS type A sorting domain-containing protein [Lentimicrobium sp.]HPF64248.1 T9SS type A sorting domain-containing protein [Lentimicrobium sp.]
MHNNRSFFLLVALVFCFDFQVKSQINAGPDVTICQGETVTLFAEAEGGYGTDSYTFEVYPYQPETYSGGTPVTFGGNQDDQIAGPFNIGFQFCFFNQYYSQFYIGSNGWVGFSYNSSWTTYTSAPIPSTSSTVPKNCIMAPWQDWHPGITSAYGPPYVYYKTIGTAPNRKLVVYWYECPMFSCTTTRGTFQIVLNEQSSIVENHLTSKPNCLTWAGGTATQGVHNSNGTTAFTATGRNSTQWVVTNESTRFVPSGIKWYTGGYPGGTIVGYGPELVVMPSSTTVYTAVINLCGGQVFSDNVTVTVIPQDNAGFGYGSSTLCQSGFSGNPVTPYPGGIYFATPPGLSINASTGNINLGASNPGTYTITHITQGSCPDTASILLTVVTSPSATFGYPQPGYCVTAINPLPVFAPGSSAGTFSATPPGLVFASIYTGEINLAASAQGTYQVTNTIPPSAACPQVVFSTMVQIYSVPPAGAPIQGPTALCENPPNTVFSTPPLANTTSYLWEMSPPSSGTIQGSGTSAMVNWADNFIGTAYIQVRGVNDCGTGPGSPPLQVKINPLPKETGTPVGPAALCQGAGLTTYFTSGSAFADHYEWTLLPSSAGIVVGNAQQITLSWSASFSGTAQLAVRGVNECGSSVWSDPLLIVVSPLPLQAEQPSGPGFFCQGGASGNYTTQGVLNASGYNWTIDPAGAGVVAGSGNSVLVNWDPAFTGIAGLRVAVINNCGAGPFSPPLQVEIAPGPQVSAGNDTTVMFGASVILKGSVQGGANPVLCHWEPASLLLNPDVMRPETLPLETTVLFSITSTDAVNGCAASDEVLIEVAGSPLAVSATADPPSFCAGEGTTLQAQALGGSGTGYQYSWLNNGVLFSNLQQPYVIPDASTVYEVRVFDGTSTVSALVSVEVWPLPHAAAGEDVFLQTGSSVQLQGSASPPGIYNFFWSPADSLINAFVSDPVTVPLYTSNLFTLLVADTHGCVSLPDQVSVIVQGGLLNASPVANPDTICLGSETMLLALPFGGIQSGYYFRWYDGNTLISELPEVNVSPLVSTVYRLEVGDGMSVIERNVPVTVLSLPVVNLIAPGVPYEDNTILACVFDTVTIELPLNGVSYLWSDGSTGNYMQLRTSGITFDFRQIWVVVTDLVSGCFSRADVNVLFNFINCSYGIDERMVFKDFVVFPNPARDMVCIRLMPVASIDMHVRLYDIRGSLLAAQDFNGDENNPACMSIGKFPGGLYLIKIETDSGCYVKKLIINR